MLIQLIDTGEYLTLKKQNQEITLSESEARDVVKLLGDALKKLGGNETSPSAGLPPKSAGPDSSGSSRGPSSSSGRGWVEIKTISGRKYAYRRWRDGKIKRSEYVGPVK